MHNIELTKLTKRDLVVLQYEVEVMIRAHRIREAIRFYNNNHKNIKNRLLLSAFIMLEAELAKSKRCDFMVDEYLERIEVFVDFDEGVSTTTPPEVW